MTSATISGPGAVLRALAGLLCFALGFGLSCFAFARILPLPAAPNVRSKLSWLATHGDEFELIFLGSSRVKNQIIPSTFDRTAAEADCPVHSFNAGISAMTPPEDSFMLEQVLQRPHRRLRWAIIELQTFPSRFNPALVGTRRADYWHDPRRMWLLTQHALADYAAAAAKSRGSRNSTGVLMDAITDWSNHLQLFIRRSTNGGQGAALVDEKLRGERNKSDVGDGGPAGDGWKSDGEIKTIEDKDRSEYNRGLDILRHHPPDRVEDPVAEESLRRMIAQLRREGVEPILLIPPQLAQSMFYPSRVVADVAVFDFSDPAKYPELYEVGNRCDALHLNLAGAALFSRQLATQFAARFKNPAR